MRLFTFALIASGLVVSAVRADDRAAARKLVEEAIVAHGGEAALAKRPVVTMKTEGIFHAYKSTPAFLFTCETTTYGAEQYKTALDGELFQQKFRVVNVLDGKRGWIKMSGEGKQDLQECSPERLPEWQENGSVNWLTTLLPLKGEELTLTLAGEEQDRDRTRVGVRVSRPGHRDVTLYFDKETKLLVKTETRATAGTDVEGDVVTILEQHKDFEGVQRPTKFGIYHNGQLLYSHWVRDYHATEKPAADLFAKP